MGVPIINISLHDVTTEIYGDTANGRNLAACFADATGIFDPIYKGSKNSLLNFRNYGNLPPP